MKLQDFINWIILVGAFVTAIWNIYKATEFGKRKIRNKRINEIKDVIKDIDLPKLEKLDDRFYNIELKINNIQDCQSIQIRRELDKIYHRFRPYRKIPQYIHDDCIDMMNKYTGNSYAKDLWRRIQEFELVEDDSFLNDKKE